MVQIKQKENEKLLFGIWRFETKKFSFLKIHYDVRQNFQGDTEKDISEFIKKFFDQKYGPNWHCCVGKHFASFVTYQSKNYMFLYIGQLAILLYKLWEWLQKD